jgi:hypothetical protein
MASFKNLFSTLNCSVLNSSNLKSQINQHMKLFADSDQQYSHEFFTFLIDYLASKERSFYHLFYFRKFWQPNSVCKKPGKFITCCNFLLEENSFLIVFPCPKLLIAVSLLKRKRGFNQNELKIQTFSTFCD